MEIFEFEDNEKDISADIKSQLNQLLSFACIPYVVYFLLLVFGSGYRKQSIQLTVFYVIGFIIYMYFSIKNKKGLLTDLKDYEIPLTQQDYKRLEKCLRRFFFFTPGVFSFGLMATLDVLPAIIGTFLKVVIFLLIVVIFGSKAALTEVAVDKKINKLKSFTQEV